MAKVLEPPGYIPPTREPEVALTTQERSDVKTWIQTYAIGEDKPIPYGKVASAAKQNFRSTLGIIPQQILIEIITEIDEEWHPVAP